MSMLDKVSGGPNRKRSIVIRICNDEAPALWGTSDPTLARSAHKLPQFPAAVGVGKVWGGRGKSRYPISFELASLSLIGCRDRPTSPQPRTFLTCMQALAGRCAQCPMFSVRLKTGCPLPITSNSPITVCVHQYTSGEHPMRLDPGGAQARSPRPQLSSTNIAKEPKAIALRPTTLDIQLTPQLTISRRPCTPPPISPAQHHDTDTPVFSPPTGARVPDVPFHLPP